MPSQWIVKVSKFCNLRCDYCYELPSLGDRARISLEQASVMFANMADFYASDERGGIQFVWHGGEPLMQDPRYYRGLFELQKRWLGNIPVSNVVQTNLTVLDDSRIELLRDGFDGVGVSVDLFGEHRLSLSGKSSQARVLANLERLQDEGIPFGCITVLTRRTLPHIEAIFRFYEATNLSVRILPLFAAATADQTAPFSVTAQEVLDALCQLFDLWLASSTRIQILPMSDLLRGLLRRRRGEAPEYYDRRSHEQMVIVDTSGDLYAAADAYRPGTSWGNIFATPLVELFAGADWDRSVRATERKMAQACGRCEYLGACPGHPVGEDNRAYTDTVGGDGAPICIVERGLCAYIERFLDEVALDPRFASIVLPTGSASANMPAIV